MYACKCVFIYLFLHVRIVRDWYNKAGLAVGVCIYIYMYTCIYIYIYICIYIFSCTYIYICICVSVYVNIYM